MRSEAVLLSTSEAKLSAGAERSCRALDRASGRGGLTVSDVTLSTGMTFAVIQLFLSKDRASG